MEPDGDRKKEDKTGGKVGPLTSGFLLCPVLWASLPSPEGFPFLPRMGWMGWRVGRFTGVGCGSGLGGWGDGWGLRKPPVGSTLLCSKSPLSSHS